jgi:hypothetical protein
MSSVNLLVSLGQKRSSKSIFRIFNIIIIDLYRGGGTGSPETICLSQNTSSYVGPEITPLLYIRQTHQHEYKKDTPFRVQNRHA